MLSVWYKLVDPTGNQLANTGYLNIEVDSSSRIGNFLDGIYKQNPGKLSSVDFCDLQVFRNKATFEQKLEPLTGFHLLSQLGQTESEDTALYVIVPSKKRPLESPTPSIRTRDEELLRAELIQLAERANQRLKSTQNLPIIISKKLEGKGADFKFSDRQDSFEKLGNLISERYQSFKKGIFDKRHHPINSIGDGPGTGKTRFLHELPLSFRQYFMENTNYSQEVRDVIKSAVYLNITFGNGTLYDYRDAHSILTATCLRVLYQFLTLEDGFATTAAFFERYCQVQLTLGFLTNYLLKDIDCFVLGIDELNFIHDKDDKHISTLIKHIGGNLLCSEGKTFIVPVIAGTNIQAIDRCVQGSSYFAISIPLPLLSYDSCVDILSCMNPDYKAAIDESFELKQLVADVGGHGRSLDFLLEALNTKYRRGEKDSLIKVEEELFEQLKKYYVKRKHSLGKAVACSFLPKIVAEDDICDHTNNLAFIDLEELGFLKLENNYVRIPYAFARAYISVSEENEFKKHWQKFQVGDQMDWKEWENFNVKYFAFRLSLFSYLNYKSVSLSAFFKGAAMNLEKDIEILVPSMDDITFEKIDENFPERSFDAKNYQSVRNGLRGQFDGFMFTETTKQQRLLLAFQMKHSSKVITMNVIKEEYRKTAKSISKMSPKTDFVFVLMARRPGHFDVSKLPNNCIVVCQEQMKGFYREALYYKIMAGKPVDFD